MLSGRPSSAQAHTTYKIDPNKSDLANALDILRELVASAAANSNSGNGNGNSLGINNGNNILTLPIASTAEEAWRLSLLAGLVRLLIVSGDSDSSGSDRVRAMLPGREFLYCLSATLVHPMTQMRAATLRAIRHWMRADRDVCAFNELQLPHLLCKSLDVLLDNEEERVQAMKLVSRPAHCGVTRVACLDHLLDSLQHLEVLY